MTLFNYSQPRYAQRTIRALQRAFPGKVFDIVPSPIAAYAFRYLIRIGGAYVEKAPLRSFNTT